MQFYATLVELFASWLELQRDDHCCCLSNETANLVRHQLMNSKTTSDGRLTLSFYSSENQNARLLWRNMAARKVQTCS